VLETKGSRAQLEALYRRGLFLTALGGGLYRYHPLFRSFLQEQAAGLPEWSGLHSRAARYYREAGLGEQALYHLLATGDTSTAAMELERWAEPWLESGRAVTLLEWIDQLPGEALSMHPQLLVAQGDAARLLARFDAARQAYREAATLYEERGDALGMARALRGEAVIYLDTVEPAQAEALLRRAFKLLPPGEAGARAELLGLIAENRLNRGRADQALRILDIEFGTAEGERAPVESALANLSSKVRNRALVRLGRLAEARGRLEAAALPARPESPASELTLLSLIGVLEGDPEAALRYAQMGLEAARHAGSALFETEAYICAGHALQLARPDDYRTANEYYLQALGAADTLHVANTGAEAYMGLALLHGFHGDVAAAEAAAREGLAIAGHSGNEWAAAQLWLVLGAVATANGSPEAEGHLARALAGFRTSKDAYGQAAAHMWLSIRRYRTGDQEQAAHYAISAFELVQRYGYAGLLTGPTLFGPRDRMMLVPVLLAARSDPAYSNEAQMLLNRGFPEIAADDNTRIYHPGVTLRIQTLGPLRVWRGMDEIRPQEWQRKKAQQMLGLLLTNRDRWLQREQICDLLWPGESSAEAEAQFKVTLNGLNAALEPLRPSRTPPFYIRRQGGAYRFCPPDGAWLDVEAFEAQMAAARALRTRSAKPGRDSAQSGGNPAAMQDALANVVSLHQGEYLSDWLYEDWARDERERLEALYMEAAVLLAETLVERGDLPEAIRLCDLVLARDPGWEDAYCVLMRAYAMQGQRRMALATYDRCVRNLRQWLDVDPLPSTVRIYEELKA
jgi:LuxR family transcriptional regulator, maltose regulon positive regulatory protein